MTNITNSTSAFFRRSLGQMGDLRALAERLQGQIGSGERLGRSSDDPAAAARLRSLLRLDRFAAVDAGNAKRASGDLGAGADALQSVADLLIRVRELAVRAGSETTGSEERGLITVEIEQLRDNILSLANSSGADGRPLFAGEADGPAYAIDGAGNVSYLGTASASTLDIGDGVRVERGVPGPQAFNFDDGGAPTDLFAFLAQAIDAMRTAADPAAAARDALGGVDTALDTLGRAQTVIGAKLAWIDTLGLGQAARADARAEEGGDVGGVEITEAVARLQQTLVVLEASQASFARLGRLTLFDAI